MTQHLLSITSDRNYPKLPFEKRFTKFVGNKIRESLLLSFATSRAIPLATSLTFTPLVGHYF
jgi:hypothetical protein